MNGPEFRSYIEQEAGGDVELVAASLSEVLGRNVSATRVRDVMSPSGSVPKSWVKALGLDDAGSLPPDGDAATASGSSTRAGERPPAAPPGAKRELPVAANLAEKNLAAFYRLVGSGMAARSGNAGIRVLTDDQAPALAKAWVQASEELEFARRVVQMASSGGAGGELVMAHAIWLLGVFYVTGRSSIDPFGTYGQKYGRYRPADPPPQAERGSDGGESPGDAVGVVAGPPVV